VDADILLIEDDSALGPQIVDQLRMVGLSVDWQLAAHRPHELPYSTFQLVILDLMLPGVYGLDILKVIRETSDVPVLILSARDDSADVVRGLKLGADDYLRKPFWPNELIARVQARLRRSRLNSTLRIGDLCIALEARTVLVGNEPVALTRVEFDLLAALAKRSGVAVTRDWLNECVLEVDDSDQRTLDVHLSRIRKKIGPNRIQTVHGIGYRLRSGTGA
jgi:DNA-binding response OmpR family regulator